MNSKRVFLLTTACFLVPLSFQSCEFSGALLNSNNQSQVNFSSSSQPTEVALKPCGGSLAPGESCTLKVQFTPTASGNRSGSVQIRSNGEVLEEVALTGQGE